MKAQIGHSMESMQVMLSLGVFAFQCFLAIALLIKHSLTYDVYVTESCAREAVCVYVFVSMLKKFMYLCDM